jgi:ATP-binding cassette subfamily B protein/subfamily B ATP-binding cassette protein MsbA|tara:strand:+ start:14140 stop:15864 length:1725 start_codon:yes stop_codon:yes gene_type:complete
MNSLLRVLSYLKPYKKAVSLTLGFAILTTLLDLIPPWIIKVIIDELVDGKKTSLINWVVVGLIGVYFLRNFLNYQRIMFNNRLEQNVVFDMRSNVYKALNQLSINFFENRSTGELMSRVNDDVNYVERIFIDGVEQVVTAILTLTGITIILFYLHWKLALVALLPIPLLIWGASIYTKKAHSLYHKVRESAAKMNSRLQDSISGIREIFAFNRQSHEISLFEKKSREYCNSNLKVMSLWAIYSPAMMFLGSLGTALILLYGTELIYNNEITIGSLVAFIGYLALFYTPINQLHSVNHMLQHALASSERIFEIIDRQPDVKEIPNAFLPTTNMRGEIEFQEVTFAYTQNKPVIKNLSLNISSGNKIALVGHTGSGKSTLIKLLLRFYDTDLGKITIDNHNIKELKISYLREQIGLVSQDPYLFNGTVAENILYGNVEANHEQMRKAAIAAHADDFVKGLPEEYDTRIGERGVKLSGGEKHRIAIARTLLKDPPILILDEATASVDTETELKIKEALSSLMARRTTILIAHRLSTLEGADRILVIKSGKLIESGTHDQMINNETEYAQLFRSQMHL